MTSTKGQVRPTGLPRLQTGDVVITGATSGIGRAAALILAQQGARLVLVGRDAARGEETAARCRAAGATAVDVVTADLALLADVRRAGHALAERPLPLLALVHNAGVAPVRRETTSEGHERGLATNVLAPFVLTEQLRAKLIASAPARVVSVAGAYHKKAHLDVDDLAAAGVAFDGLAEGNRQKLLLVTFAIELARRLQGTHVTSNALHPGIARTGIQRELPWPYQWLMRTVLRPLFGAPEGPAQNVVRLVVDPALERVTGGYFHEARSDAPAAQARDPAVGAAVWSFLARATAS